MRKITEALRLRYELGLGYRQIAGSCRIGLGAVSEHLKRTEAAGLKWPLPGGMTEEKLNELLFGRPDTLKPEQALPDFGNLHEQLGTHKHLTLQMLWEEYRQTHPDGYGYSRFCELVSAAPHEARPGAAPGTHPGRTNVRRLGRRQTADPRCRHRNHSSGVSVRRRAGPQQLHVGRTNP